jgi:energy-coupling factor transport system substrate-specific component
VSWQFATFAGLAAVLVCGFAWFERSRPSSRLVALVAALAALAVAGRLVLAPIPNVVATTDIALITGYALGAAPGFAVGALAAPISNLWLGQGPWTPWEMAGWGLVGLAGAALARVTGRRLGRVGMACACGLAGLAYGALMDLSLMVTYGGEQSLDRFLALSARGVPFNVAHAAGNFALALAAGPALVAMISRYRTRMRFRWHPAGALPLLVLALLLLPAPPPAQAGGGVGAAAKWLERARQGDGGYAAGPGLSANPQMTGWAILGLEAAGRNPLDVGPRGRTPIDYLRRNARRIRSIGDLERTILALEGAGLDSRSFAGRDLVAELERRQRRDGSFGGQVNLTAYGVLALRAGGGSGAGAAARWLRAAQNDDGGWGFVPGQRSEADSTGAAMQGLAAVGSEGPLGRAVRYLRRSQRPEGGWAIYGTGLTNTQSTAWAVQGLVAAGVPPGRVRRGGRSGLDYLRRMQRGDGSFRYSASGDQTPVWVTAQALLALTREALPIEPVPRSRTAAEPQPDVPAGESPRPSASSEGRPGGARAERRRARKERSGRSERPRERRRGSGRAATVLGAQDGELASQPFSGRERGGDRLPLYVGGGLGGLALALFGGYLWLRRRLDSEWR